MTLPGFWWAGHVTDIPLLCTFEVVGISKLTNEGRRSFTNELDHDFLNPTSSSSSSSTVNEKLVARSACI